MSWYYSQDPEFCQGPEETREAAIEAGHEEWPGEAFTVAEGQPFKLLPPGLEPYLAEWFDSANEEYTGPDYQQTAENWDNTAYLKLCADMEALTAAWLAEHGYDRAWALDLGPSEQITAREKAA